MTNKKAYVFITKNNGILNAKLEYLEQEKDILSLIQLDEEYRTSQEVCVYELKESMEMLQVLHLVAGILLKEEQEDNVETVLAVQEYAVAFDMGNPVDLKINVYHEDKTRLSRQEIIEEALGYAQEVKIDVQESDVLDIVTVALKLHHKKKDVQTDSMEKRTA